MNTHTAKTLFNHIFENHSESLVRFAMSYLRDRDDAEDIVQDVFTSLWGRIDEIAPDRNYKSLLFTATKNSCISLLRKKATSTTYLGSAEAKINLIALDYSTIESIDAKELQLKIDRIMMSLPEDCREIFWMSREEGLRYSDIAEHRGISVKTVEKKMSTTLKALRRKIWSYCLLW